MQKTKKELVDEILSIEDVDTKVNLMKKSSKELGNILSGLSDGLDKSGVQEDVQPQLQTQPEINMDLLLEQLKADLLPQLKEQAKSEVLTELKSNSKGVDYEKIPMHQPVEIMNVSNGKCIYTSKRSGAEWKFLNYGDIETMEFQEILTMRSSQRRFIDEPFILIMDDEVVDHLGLTKMYETMVNPDKIDEVYKLNFKDFADVLEKSPKGIKHLIITRARELYDSEKLDSVKIVRLLNDKYNAEIGLRVRG